MTMTVLKAKAAAAIARLAAQEQNYGGKPRAINGLHISADNGTVRLEATDGTMAIRHSYAPDNPDEYPEIPGIERESESDGAIDAIIPAGIVMDASRAAPRRASRTDLRDRMVLATDGDSCALGSTDLDTYPVHRGKTIDGQYPNLDAAIPRGEAQATIMLSASRLIRLLKAMQPVIGTGKDNDDRIALAIYGERKPITIFGTAPDDTKNYLLGILQSMKVD